MSINRSVYEKSFSSRTCLASFKPQLHLESIAKWFQWALHQYDLEEISQHTPELVKNARNFRIFFSLSPHVIIIYRTSLLSLAAWETAAATAWVTITLLARTTCSLSSFLHLMLIELFDNILLVFLNKLLRQLISQFDFLIYINIHLVWVYNRSLHYLLCLSL